MYIRDGHNEEKDFNIAMKYFIMTYKLLELVE